MTVETAYADPLARFQEGAVSELNATLVLRERTGAYIWLSPAARRSHR